MAYHQEHGVETRIVRIFNTYGPRMRLHDGRVVPAFISQALKNRPLTVFGEGQQTRSFCYVSDLIEGIYRLMMSDYDQPVNIGNPAEMTVLEFAREIIRATGSRSKIVFKPLAAGRSQAAPAGHHAGPENSGMGAEGPAGRRAGQDHRVFPGQGVKVWRGPVRDGARKATLHVRGPHAFCVKFTPLNAFRAAKLAQIALARFLLTIWIDHETARHDT